MFANQGKSLCLEQIRGSATHALHSVDWHTALSQLYRSFGKGAARRKARIGVGVRVWLNKEDEVMR